MAEPLDRYSKISELLADFAQTVAHTMYLQCSKNIHGMSDIKVTREIIRADLLDIVDEFVQKRNLFKDAIDSYENDVTQKIKKKHKEIDFDVEKIINKRIKDLFGNFEKYLDLKFKSFFNERFAQFEKGFSKRCDKIDLEIKKIKSAQLQKKVITEKVIAKKSKRKKVIAND